MLHGGVSVGVAWWSMGVAWWSKCGCCMVE